MSVSSESERLPSLRAGSSLLKEGGAKLMFYKYLFLIIVSVNLFGLSCIQLGENYDIDKASPNSIYRVKIEVRAKEGKNTTRGYIERVKIQYFKGQETIDTEEWDNPYQYEPTFRQAMPVVEWVDDNVLRMGENRSKQPFNDELIVFNNTDEYIKWVKVNYGKFEWFQVFDLAPQSQVTLHASPGFVSRGSSRDFLGYSGMTASGKKFQSLMQSKKRKSPDEGPVKLQIAINPKDL